ncbi:MAG: zinc ribbon domain-containing protein [Candidatus Eisenbacteria bacterium]|uniref:Zinc ribbon domain-containing protein n=1 Tax=Eiseniibacteriota bacterium TaxID=2212470 RepID=A0A538U9P6_UNCEI|nr:MAG: zinc ribbon domain-containing protein [Candidatus Eisenbacteria bacterium]
MPIFEYRCTSCGERYETLVSRAERATPRCPRCGGAQAERLISTFAVGRARPAAPTPGPCGSADCACRPD